MQGRSCLNALQQGIIGSELRGDADTKGVKSVALLLVLSREHIGGVIGAVAHRANGQSYRAEVWFEQASAFTGERRRGRGFDSH
jgi:hypothetical protein